MRLFLLICGIWNACLFNGWAVQSDLSRTATGRDVEATLTSPFPMLPPGGSVPFRLTIRNDASAAGTWHATFRSGSNVFGSGNGEAIYETEDLPVAANSSQSFDLVVTLNGNHRPASMALGVKIAGPGFKDSMLENNLGYFYANTFRAKSPYTLFGAEVLGAGRTGFLESWYKESSRELYGGAVDASMLPSDWRAYAGVAAICLKDTEWLALTPPQHDALCGYVAQGGEIILFTSEPEATRVPELRLPEIDGQPGRYGFGFISVAPVSTFPPEPETLDAAVAQSPAVTPLEVDQNFSTWSLRRMVGAIRVNGALILLFVLFFGALVGPINMFIFARGKNRFNLFWTTPLISIVASFVLVLGILMTDGVGGNGRQMMVTYSLPGSHAEAVIQEQIARTDLLFSNGWRNRQNYLITPISEQSINNAEEDTKGSYHYRGAYASIGNESGNYRQAGDQFTGSWFRSRAVVGQYLETVRPSRSVLTVLNPSAFQAGRPPVILSSFPEELARVFIVDSESRFWMCDRLEPGRKQGCTIASEAVFDHFWTKACAPAGGRLREVLGPVERKPGYFFASGVPPASDRLATLDAIHWEVASGIYLGPYVSSPASENFP